MAVFNMRVNPNTGVAKALGFNPKGVVVDNVTPYWLYFPQADQYCPPFTMGWTAPLILNSNGYGYMQIQTPFGRTNQSSVPAGVAQYVNLSWTSDDTSYQPGTPGDTGSSVDPTTDISTNVYEILSYSDDLIVSAQLGLNLSPIPGFAATPGIKYRFLTVEAFLMPFAGFPSINFDSAIHWEIKADNFPSGGADIKGIASGRVSLENPESAHYYNNGNDSGVGYEIMFQAYSDFATNYMRLHITYQRLQAS